MGEVTVEGPRALEAVQRLVTNDLAKCADGQAQYSGLLNERGGFIDDVIVYRRSAESLFICVNATGREKDFLWMKEHAGEGATVAQRSDDWAQVAVQGPAAAALVDSLCAPRVLDLGYYHFREAAVAGVRGCILARTGYTGEDGFELYASAAETERLWGALVDAGRGDGVAPIGLGARDTLRLEMKYALYGNDIDETTNALEAGLGWVVKPAKGEFIGKDALEKIRAEGLTRRLVGIEMLDRAVARHGYPVLKDGRRVGVVTSGSYGPSVDKYIAMAYVETPLAGVGTELAVEIRGQAKAARVVRTPFYASKVKKAG
jgi:aminomethyltransferase